MQQIVEMAICPGMSKVLPPPEARGHMAFDLAATSRLPVDGFPRKSRNPSEAAGAKNGVRPWHITNVYATA
jgi:hypothetical protein